MINVSRAYSKNQKDITVFIMRIAMAFLLLIFIPLFSGIMQTSLKPASQPSGVIYERIVVQPGDTLWGLASGITDSDPNILVSQTINFNKLKNDYIQPGQVIYMPVK